MLTEELIQKINLLEIESIKFKQENQELKDKIIKFLPPDVMYN